MGWAVISVRVTAALGGFRLDAAFDAPAGVTVLFGRSGCGKTSVVNAVAGLLTPDAGRIAVSGRVLYDSADGTNLPAHRRHIGYVFQNARLFPHMSVARNLAYGGKSDAEKVIAMLGLSDLLDRRPAALSGGERQRVALGRALMSGPRLLLMDEPLASLDADRKALILPYLERLRDEVALPILYVTHDVSEAARLGTTMALMENGRISRVGVLSDVLSDPSLPGREAGAVLEGRLAGTTEDGLTRVALAGGEVLIPGGLGPEGAHVRLRIPAQDVILSIAPPVGLSALNVLPVEVVSLSDSPGGGVDVMLSWGPDSLLARITARSAAALSLVPGQTAHAIVKARALPG